MRVSPPLELRPGDAAELRSLVTSRRAEAGLARRARIVLLAADGLPHTEIAERVGVSVPTVREWRARYASGGIDALRDLPRSGRPKTVDEVEIVVATLSPPSGQVRARRWSSRLLASTLGVSPASVVEVWHKWGFKPWREQRLRFATDPPLDASISDVAGLYLSPLGHAVVVCVGEGSQRPALDRAQQILPSPDHSSRAPLTFASHRAARLYAALDAAAASADSGYPPGRAQEFVEFLEWVSSVRPHGNLHVVWDRCAIRRHPGVTEWLAAHPRVILHFVRADAWLAMAQAFLTIADRRRAPHESFDAVADLIDKIGESSAAGGTPQASFMWISGACDLLVRIKREETSRSRCRRCGDR